MAAPGLLGLQWSGVTADPAPALRASIAADAGQGIADVHDPRLGELARVSRVEADGGGNAGGERPSHRRWCGAPGAVEEELGGELLAHMRTTDAVVLVVRCFHDDQVAHPWGG